MDGKKHQQSKENIYGKITLYVVEIFLAGNLLITKQLLSHEAFCAYNSLWEIVGFVLQFFGSLFIAFAIRLASLVNAKNPGIELLKVTGIAIVVFFISFLIAVQSLALYCFVF